MGWYLRFSLSYRDVEELLAERGLRADHVTVWRWVQHYGPEMEQRLRRRLKPTNDSWRVDETYIRVKGKWVYLYRAVDSTGATIDFLLSAKRDADAAKRFLAKACCFRVWSGRLPQVHWRLIAGRGAPPVTFRMLRQVSCRSRACIARGRSVRLDGCEDDP